VKKIRKKQKKKKNKRMIGVSNGKKVIIKRRKKKLRIMDGMRYGKTKSKNNNRIYQILIFKIRMIYNRI